MEIKKENVLAAYETAREAGADSTMKVLEALFGEETFKPKDVTERIKTFEEAARAIGINDPEEWEERYSNLEPDVLAYLKLRIICAALNEGWEPKFTKEESRYYPWFWLYTQDEINDMDEQNKQDRHLILTGNYETEYAGFAFAGWNRTSSDADMHVGSRLCLKTRQLAVYCGKQFIDIWADFCLIRR